jgi:hypothetical protein
MANRNEGQWWGAGTFLAAGVAMLSGWARPWGATTVWASFEMPPGPYEGTIQPYDDGGAAGWCSAIRAPRSVPGSSPAPVKATVVVGAALAAALLAGCGSLHLAPYNGRESCDGVGGTYTADGRCEGGSASLDHDVTEGIQSRGLDRALGR